MPSNKHSLHLLRIGEILYLALTAFSFYLLFISRTGEAYTIWQVLNPALMPTIFAAASLLLMIMLTSEKTTYKLLLVIIISIVLHSFFSIILPAGDSSGQQLILGRVRLVFDNTVIHGLTGWPNKSIEVFIYELFTGANLQAALSVVFARLLSTDIFYVHLFFIPILWGTFTPVAAFLVTKEIGGSEKASAVSSLIISAFPYPTYFGAISVPNSLGFIFFFFSLYFMLKYLSSSGSTTKYWMTIFSFFSFLSHYLTGIMSFSLLLLTLALKAYETDKKTHPLSAKASVITSFLIAVMLLPLSFIYLNLLGTSTSPTFTLDILSEMPPQEIIKLFLIGNLAYSSDLQNILLNVIGPALAFLSMVYIVYRLRRNPTYKFRVATYFLVLSFSVMLIDYRILTLFMSRLPINTERLWVLRDFTAVPFVALAIYTVTSQLKAFLKTKAASTTTATGETTRRHKTMHASTAFIVLNILIPLVLGGWITLSLTAAYPQAAPLQVTSYELEAVRHIETITNVKYVVIGDFWTIYAGEMVVGINNPRAYYYDPSSKTGYDLFTNMTKNPSPHWMLLAMNYTNTKLAYFIVTEPRVGTNEFEKIVSQALQNKELAEVGAFGDRKLYIFSYQ
jgi:hypothetical protein